VVSKCLPPPTSDNISCSFLKSKILRVIKLFSLNYKTKWFKSRNRLSSLEVTETRFLFSPLPSEIFFGNGTHEYSKDVFTIHRTDVKHYSVTVIHTRKSMKNMQDITKNIHVRSCPKHTSVYKQK